MLASVCAWFAMELAFWLMWRQALRHRRTELLVIQRVTALSVRMFHAIGATSLSFRMLASNGSGLMGDYDRQPCIAVPWAEEAIHFSLSWSFWELCSVFRDIRGEGTIMLLHGFILATSLSCVLATGYMKHMMASHITQELSTVFLNARLLFLTLRGKEVAHGSPFYNRVTMAFGLSFMGVRLGYGFPRVAAHLHAVFLGVQRHGWLDTSTSPDGCEPVISRATLVAVDVLLHLLQVGLNLLWATQIISAAARRARRDEGARTAKWA